MDKVEKFLYKLSAKERAVAKNILVRVQSGNLKRLDLKKLRGEVGIYRVRKGNIRIIFSIDGEVKILSIGRRNDTTYRL